MSKKKKGISANGKWGIALALEIVILLLMAVIYVRVFVQEKMDKIQVVEVDEQDLNINEGANEAQEHFTTIALFGIDARSNTDMLEGNRSDSIMIASINNETKEVKIVSVYRDTLLQIADGDGLTTKVNAAYSYGGPELAMKTLNANLDLQITEFVTVNFMALTKAIDDLGGITIDVQSNELEGINASVAEQINVTGIYSDGVFTAGEQVLNGTQATAYARIRSTDQGDITRTERQRTVLAKMVEKAKSSGLDTIEDVIDDVFPNICTSIDHDQIMDLAKSLFDYEMGDTIGFPMAYYPMSHETKGAVLVPADLSSNVSALHQFLFGTTDYQPTAAVEAINSQLYSETGVGPQEIIIDPLIMTR